MPNAYVMRPQSADIAQTAAAAGEPFSRRALFRLVGPLVAAVLALFPGVLFWTSSILGFKTPSNALLAAAVLYLAVNVLFNTVASSVNAARLRRLTQECALLRAEVEALRARDRADPPP